MPKSPNWTAIGVFIVASYALGAVAASPMFLLPPSLEALGSLALVAMMFTPSVAVLLVHRFVEPIRELRVSTGLVLGERRLTSLLFAWLGTPALVLTSIALAAGLGWLETDLTNLSGMVALITAAGGAEVFEQMSPHTLLVLQLAQALLLAALINTLFAFGEEWGWRGWLLPQLMPLGTWPALLLSGAIWGAWHTVAIIGGHNFPGEPLLGPLMMTTSCTVWGVWFGWLRLRSGSVLYPALAHALFNGTAGMVALVGLEGSTHNPLLTLVVGVSGLLVAAGTAALLGLTGQLAPSAQVAIPQAD